MLAEYTLPFNENDITSFVPLSIRTVGILGFFPTHLTADAAFDAWYTYQMVAPRQGMAAIPLNSHGHPEGQRAPDGVPLCAKGLCMHPTCEFSHTCGYRSQRFRCPLLFPLTLTYISSTRQESVVAFRWGLHRLSSSGA